MTTNSEKLEALMALSLEELLAAGDALDAQTGNAQGASLKRLTDQIRSARGPARQTLWRHQGAGEKLAPAIARTSKARQENDGRLYGELPAGSPEQRQADAGDWEVGKRVREQLHPFAISVDGTVERVYEVLGWKPSGEPRKWIAILGKLLTNTDLDAIAGYPLRIGDSLPTRRGKAYRPIPFS